MKVDKTNPLLLTNILTDVESKTNSKEETYKLQIGAVKEINRELIKTKNGPKNKEEIVGRILANFGLLLFS